MADDEGSGERTEEATVTRREEFRKRGQVAQSRELASVLVIFSTALCIYMLGQFFLSQVMEIYSLVIGEYIYTTARSDDFFPALKFTLEKMVLILGPLFAIAVVLAIASSALQTGFIYNEEALEFRFDRLDPIAGFRRIFSLTAIVEGLKAVLKVTIVVIIAGSIIRNEIEYSPLLVNYSIQDLISYLGQVIVKLLFGVGAFMAVLAVLDYAYIRWDLEKKMRMTKQEVKEEHKSREGDPLIKARIRKIQRELANKRMMESVPKADVIITNPTHIAVALKYDETMPSPKLIAKGADLIAGKIKELAKEHDIPIVENVPLARAIYKTLKIGQFIPRELFSAVAEVLAYVYKLKRKVVR